MNILKPIFWMMLVLFTLTGVGCSLFETKEEEGLDKTEETTAISEETGNDISTGGYNDGSDLNGTEIKGVNSDVDTTYAEGSLMGSNADLMGGEFADPKHPLSTQIIYFLYDSSQVRPEFVKVIATHSQYLVDNPEQKVILEGHADERGSPEYNVALSEQRAKSVSRTMQRQGVLKAQMTLVSYGEEKPSAFEHDEAAWQLNRRVEIAYQANK